jgi:16S rRNA (adenine1518-N6/adenine1519-N6)-dimethyltransferase
MPTAEDYHAILAGLGVRLTKDLGQHLLLNEQVRDIVVEGGALKSSDCVIEIGPGTGVLTAALVAQSQNVHVIEQDPRFAEYIRTTFPMVTVHEGDALRILPDLVPTLGAYKVVANLPYQITTPLFRLLLEGKVTAPQQVSLLIQKEVAERVAAAPRNRHRGYLSVILQRDWVCEIAAQVPPGAFFPPPKVDSAVLVLTPHTDASELLRGAKVQRWLRSMFLQPRKQLKNVLAGQLHCEPEVIAEYLKEAGADVQTRAFELTEAQIISLAISCHVMER